MKVLASEHEDLSLILKTHPVGEENQQDQMNKWMPFLKERWKTWLKLGISGLATSSKEIIEWGEKKRNSHLKVKRIKD